MDLERLPKLKDNEEIKLVYLNDSQFHVLTWNETHVDEYIWDGVSTAYTEIKSYRRHCN